MTITMHRLLAPTRARAGYRHAAVAAASLCGLLYCFAAQAATDLATRPLRGALLVEPNVVFAYDDSGSMDSEILLDTDDGALWWNSTVGSAWFTGQGRPYDSADSGSLGQYRKLFPQMAVSLGAGTEDPGINVNLARALPPIPELAWVRSAAFNRIYYDPLVTYKPWPAANEAGGATTITYPPASFDAATGVAKAKTHPSDSLSPQEVTLTSNLPMPVNVSSQTTRVLTSFRFAIGMKFPSNAKRQSDGASLTAGQAATAQVDVVFDYYPATFWHLVPPSGCVVDNVSCVASPKGDGNRLKRYEIRSGGTYPGPHTSFEAQIQNFANWFQYHRKRKLFVADALGRVITGLGEGLRVGNAFLNGDRNDNGTAIASGRPDIQLTSTTGTGGDAVRKKLAGLYYTRSILNGAPTPTLATLNHVHTQFDTKPALIQNSCQRNNVFLITDGYPNPYDGSWGSVPTYDRTQFGGSAPHAETTSATRLADMALYHFTKRLRSADYAAGNVPTGDPLRPNADVNASLHLNTYAITLGVSGLYWPKDRDANTNLPKPNTVPSVPGGLAWKTNPTGRERLDDLWHATINGRGQMLLSNNGEELASAVSQVLFDIASVQGAQGAASFSSVNLSANEFALLASYNAGRWNGDLARRTVDAATADVGTIDVWSAAAQLDALADPATRVLFTKDGPFDAATVGAQVDPAGSSAVRAAKVDYLRGARGNEGFGSGQFRPRLSRFGAVVGSVPVINEARSAVFVAANDGLLHAVSVSDGKELWAYAPRAVLAEMGASTQLNWNFKTLHDGSPTLAKVSGGEWLFNGLGSGGKGWYALDVSAATDSTLTAAQRAQTVKWELPGTDATLASQMGAAVARPLVVKRSSDGAQVVLLTSGYNASIADGRGRLFVRDAATGAELTTLETPAVAPAGEDPGLAHVSAFRETDGTVRYVYGGDLKGNLWRFDLGTASAAPSVMKLAQLTDGASPAHAQAISVRPTLVAYQGKRIVLVGTGSLLGASDLAPEPGGRINSLYALWDNDTPLSSPRTTLVKQTLTVDNAAGTRSISTPQSVNFNTQRGWFIDLPLNERANIPALVGITAASWVTNQPDTNPCQMKAYRYAIDILKGTAPDTAFGVPGVAGSVLASLTQGAAGHSLIAPSGGGGAPSVKDCVRGLDGKLYCGPFESDTAAKPRKTGWRRVVR